MKRSVRFKTETKVQSDRGWSIGRVHLNVVQPDQQLTGAGPVSVLFHGDLFNQRELSQSIVATGEYRSTAGLIEALYRACGPRFAVQLKGNFCCAVLDDQAHRIHLVSDRFGSYPLYWSHTSDGFAFASEVRALPNAGATTLNPHTVNDLLQFGFPLGDKTLANGVQLLPSASTLTYEWTTDRVSVDRYASWDPAFRATGIDKRAYFDELAQTFTASMKRAVLGSHAYGLSLSGGLDTRVLLSALDDMGVPLSTFTLGENGCADEVIGYQLARLYGSRHEFVPLEERALASLLPMTERMVSLTDGLYTSHGFTEVLALQAFEQSGVTMLLRGHAGELAKASTAWPFHTDAAIFAMRAKNELVPYQLARFESLNHGSVATGLFSERWKDAEDWDYSQRSLNDAYDADLSPVDLCSYVYLHDFHRRVTVPSLEIFREYTEVRLPFADLDLVECLFQGEPAWRNGVEVHQSLIARGKPAYLKIRNPNTGAPAGAGPLQEFVLDKLNTILRRLNVYGYRHYHAFDGWMRRAFLSSAEQVLLAPQSLDRGTLQLKPLRGLFERARGGDAAPDHVLQVLLLVELWQRQQE
jgi:asparagine synthase (glutamine-hydrolysing)